MFNIVRRFASRISSHEPRDERAVRPSHGPLVKMLESDVSNLDHLARDFSELRRERRTFEHLRPR